MPAPKKISVIILAGGNSSRMMEDKGLVDLNDKPLIEYCFGVVKNFDLQIIIISANPGYRQFGFPCFEDLIKEKGPLGGIYTGLVHSTTQKNLVLGCDMPFISEHIIAGLINNCKDEDVLITEHMEKAEPLCAIYDKNCIPHFRALMEKNKLKITDAFRELKSRAINFDKEDWFRGDEFTNINSKKELQKYQISKK